MAYDRKQHERVRAAFAHAGFCVQNTGGGCQAYCRFDATADLMTLVTIADDASLPERFAEPVYAGRYAVDEDGCYEIAIDGEDYESAAALLARWI